MTRVVGSHDFGFSLRKVAPSQLKCVHFDTKNFSNSTEPVNDFETLTIAIY